VSRRGAVAFVLTLAGMGIVAGPTAPAAAHPLGNFTVNLYSGIQVMPERFEVEYVLDMAEVPTFREKRVIDTDRDGDVSESERAAWADRTARDLAEGLSLSVDGRTTEVELISRSMRLLPGQGGLEILRLEATYAASAPDAGRLEYRDENFGDRLGWREIIAIGREGRKVHDATVPDRSVSDALRFYPEDLLSSPLDVTQASVVFGPGSQTRAGPAVAGSSARPGEGGAFVGLIARPSLSGAVILLSLLLAFGLGGLHALAPGHGKTLMAAYLVGTGGRVRQAVAVGAAVSAMHTASVLGIGLLVLWVQTAVEPEQAYPWLGLAAGVIAMALGAGLFRARLRTRSAHGEHGYDHSHEPAAASPLSRRGLAAIAVSGGILPSPAALLVLLAAVALHRVAFGLSLIVAFSIGLATSLVVIGILAIRARDLVAHRFHDKVVTWLPLLSAGAIALVGLILTIRALAQF
jgi:ABC-type nickel/cobalt efflux system permease component RcnA